MKILIFFAIYLLSFTTFSQEHFAGVATSSRTGIINADLNPAELVNIKHKFEINIFATSITVNNNKIGFKELTSGKDLKDLLFRDNNPVSLNFKTEIFGPGYAMKIKKFAVGISTKLNAKFDIVDLDSRIGEAIANGGINGVAGITTINNNTNQRITGTTWGEIDLLAAVNLLNSDKNKISAGATFKLLFPGSFANVGAQNYIGTITTSGTVSTLSNTQASLNFAYSGGLANSFTNFNDYAKSIFGSLNGFATDLGINYQLKDEDKDKYKLNIGLSIKNIGTMTFKDDNNASTSYNLNIGSGSNALNLNLFDNVNSIQQAENILISNRFLDKIVANKQDFKVQMPTQFAMYADVKIISKIFITGYLQQRVKDNNSNNQITSQNLFTITPRFTTNYFEVYLPITKTEIAGTSAGFGVRIGGFYIGSSSGLTSLINDSKQVDVYTGFRWSFL